MANKKHNAHQLVLNFEIVHISISESESRTREQKRARNIVIYTNQIHRCIDGIYEHLVDREYQDFKDEVESAIEYLEYLRDHGDKTF